MGPGSTKSVSHWPDKSPLLVACGFSLACIQGQVISSSQPCETAQKCQKLVQRTLWCGGGGPDRDLFAFSCNCSTCCEGPQSCSEQAAEECCVEQTASVEARLAPQPAAWGSASSYSALYRQWEDTGPTTRGKAGWPPGCGHCSHCPWAQLFWEVKTQV